MRLNPAPTTARRLLAALACGALPHAAAATAATTAPQAGESPLEEIVVTARRAPEVLMEASASISVLDAADLARSTASGLADAMRDLPGIQASDAGQPGLKRIRIRGEESRRTAILVDGQEITDHWEVGTPLSLHPAMVERIEVVRGSGSVLYGPRALSGVVNFITRKGGTQPLQLETSSSFDSATGGNDQFASVFGDLQGTGYRLALASGHHGERDTPQGDVGNTAFDNQGAYAWLGRDFGAHRLEASYDRYESNTDVYVEEAVRTAFPLIDFRIDVPQRDREKVALRYEWRDPLPTLGKLTLTAHHQDNARRFDTATVTLLPGPRPLVTERQVFSDAALELDDVLLQLDWTPADAHYVVAGVEYTEERVNQERRVAPFVNGIPQRPEHIHDEASIRTVAAFAHDTITLGDRTQLEAGVRQYGVDGSLEGSDRPGLAATDRSDTAAVASLGFSHLLGDDLSWRLSAAQGYVYPSLLQFATGAYAGSRYVNPNPDVDPERAWSVETGLRFRRDGWNVDAGVFHTRSEDYIDHVFCTASDPCLSIRDKIYVNVGESAASGLEAWVSREGEGPWTPYASLTWMKRDNTYETFSTGDSGTPALAGTLGLRWEPVLSTALLGDAWLDLALRGESASRREEPASSGSATLTRDDAWTTVDLAAGASLGSSRRLRVVIELGNLADASYSTSAENLLAPGRNVSARFDLAID